MDTKKATLPKGQGLQVLLPEVWALVRPRRGLLTLGFVVMAINRASGVILPASVKFLVDDVIGRRHLHLLLPLVAVVLGATAVQGFTSLALTQVLSNGAQRLIAGLRCRVQAHVGRLPIAFFDANETGTLVSRIMSDVEGIRNLVGTGLVEFAGGLLTAAFALVVLFYISPAMTGVVFLVLTVFGLFEHKSFETIWPIFRERSRVQAEVTGRLTESLGGVRVVKGYYAEEREAEVFSGNIRRLLNNVLRTQTAISTMTLASTVAIGLVSAAIMYLGTREIISGKVTLGSFLTYAVFLGVLAAPVCQIVGIGTQITEALAGLARTRELLQERPEYLDAARVVVLPSIHGAVAFENVSFSYDSGKPVLHDISFRADPDSVTALVGPSGAGKSTIIGLLAAFYVPTSGTVRVDGIDLATVKLEAFRTQLGVVLQETFLFDGTIRENVAFSRPSANEEQILAACRIARVDEFAEKFEKGYDTVVGERGVKLSGGQRQRVSIARAILADPRILILDEATSSLDSESEAMIQEGLAYLMRGRTTFVIAHRLSTVRLADRILVLENGRLIESGTHDSLYRAGGRYFELYAKQHAVESNLFLAPGEGDEVVEVVSEKTAGHGVEIVL